jgi:uncharacterized protein with HEPN domain
MPHDGGDQACLWDMLDAASAIVEFTSGVSMDAYLSNRLLQAAVERKVEIIGEAARQVSEKTRRAHPGIPWRRIVAQRNVLAHQYGEIRQDLMWRLATGEVPKLLADLRRLLDADQDEA